MTQITPNSSPVDIDQFMGETTAEERAFITERTMVQTAASLVRVMRNRAGLDQKSAAAEARTSQSAISDIERAVGPNGPTVAVMARIAHACRHRLVLTAEPLADDEPMDTRHFTTR